MQTTSEAKRAARRAAMPQITAIVEHYEREGFSPQVIYARENGITVGKKPANENAFDIPKGYRMPTGDINANRASNRTR